MRAYTPSSSTDTLGHFDLVIKVYRRNDHPKFPDGGKMSQFLDTLAIGDPIEVKGPVGHVHYLGRGRYTLDGEAQRPVKQLNLIAGGTGITPCWQVLQAILKDPEDTTQVALLYANQTPDDILLKAELDAAAAEHSNFKVWYTVDRAEGYPDWPFSQGFINKAMLAEQLLPAGEDAVCCMCGPPGLIAFACVPNLKELGFDEAQMIKF